MKEKSKIFMKTFLLNMLIQKISIRIKTSNVRLPDQKSFKQMKYYMNKNQKLIKIDKQIKIGSKDQNQMNESKVIFTD